MARYGRSRLTPAAIAIRERVEANPPAPYVVPPPRRRYPVGAWPGECDAQTGIPLFASESWPAACILSDHVNMRSSAILDRWANDLARRTPAGDLNLAAAATVLWCRIMTPVGR